MSPRGFKSQLSSPPQGRAQPWQPSSDPLGSEITALTFVPQHLEVAAASTSWRYSCLDDFSIHLCSFNLSNLVQSEIPLFLLIITYFNWKIIALQYCVDFCHITTWIRHRYIYMAPPSWASSHLLPHSTSLGYHRASELSFLRHTGNSHCLSNFTYGSAYVSMLISQFFPPTPSLTVSTSLFSMFTSPLLPCKQVHQCHLSRFHIYPEETIVEKDTCTPVFTATLFTIARTWKISPLIEILCVASVT